MGSKGEWIRNLVESHEDDINSLEYEIVSTYKNKIEKLKDTMIDKLKAKLENIGFEIYIQWIQKYDSFDTLTDFSLNEYFLAKLENKWFFIRVVRGEITINGKMFRKFETIDLNKVTRNLNEDTLKSVGYIHDKDTNQLKLVNKDNCTHSHIYITHRHRDFSRKFKLDKFFKK